MRAVRALLVAAIVLHPGAGPAAAVGASRPAPTPVLLDRAVARGDLDRAAADRYLALAFTDASRVPSRFRSDVPWRGTEWLLELRDRVSGMPQGADRAAIRSALAPLDSCDGLTGPNEANTAHFHIHHTTTGGGLDISDYAQSLETAWTTEVDSFGWAAPPTTGPYLVVTAPLGALFGYVTPTAVAGDNPNTPWNEGDALASCMVLNSDYSAFPPSSPQQALDATTAHEFNHAIQFGYGALTGDHLPDAVFYEGIATWMEDEVFDDANDNYRYLWPDFTEDMGEYRSNDPLANPYAYWVIWRAMTERFGAGVAGGGEDVMQAFWELTSQNVAGNLEAMDRALRRKGTTLPDAYHAAGIALKFNRACGGGYIQPYCLEEGPAYVAARGPTPLHGHIANLGGALSGNVLDNYALNWISLPSTGPFEIRLRNASNGGRLRASVACDSGASILVRRFPKQAGPKETVAVRRFDPAGCQSVVAVISNVAQTEANPSSSVGRRYRLSVLPPSSRTRITLRVRLRPGDVVATGRLRPPHPRDRIRVTLFERDGGRWDRMETDRPRLRKGRRYRAVLQRPDGPRCRIEARFPGDADHRPSERRRTFAC